MPPIIDENGEAIMKIDSKNIVAKKGSNSRDLKNVQLKEGQVNFRCWNLKTLAEDEIANSCVYQFIEWSNLQESDSGFYQFDLILQNKIGLFTKETIYVELLVFDNNIAKSMEAFSDIMLMQDIIFRIDQLVKENENCGNGTNSRLTRIDRFDLHCKNTNNDYYGFMYCKDVFVLCLEAIIPQADGPVQAANDGREV